MNPHVERAPQPFIKKVSEAKSRAHSHLGCQLFKQRSNGFHGENRTAAQIGTICTGRWEREPVLVATAFSSPQVIAGLGQLYNCFMVSVGVP